MNEKGKVAEAAYQKAVDNANDVAKETYGTHLPPILDALQTLEEERYNQAKFVLEIFSKEFRALPDQLIERADELAKALDALGTLLSLLSVLSLPSSCLFVSLTEYADMEADLSEYVDEKKGDKTEPEVIRFVAYKEPAAGTTTSTSSEDTKEEESKTEVEL